MDRSVTINESLALTLYHELKSDSEIGKAVGKSHDTIFKWRKRKNLPTLTNQSSNYRDVLTLKQCEEMHRFLRCLAAGAIKAQQMGIKPDVGAAINGWRG